MEYDVFGIGNALMDFLVRVDDSHLIEFDLEKGGMKIVDKAEINEIKGRLENMNVKTAPGGSVANTLAGIANLGGSVVFCGTVGHDKEGIMYEEKLNESGILPKVKKASGITGQVMAFITPDSERTFATYFGVALNIVKEQVVEGDIKNSKVLHLTGYQLEDPQLRETAIHAMEIAKKNDVMISIDVADPFLVKRTKNDILETIKRYAGIVFANEEEAKVLTGLEDPERSLNVISELVEVAIVKTGKEGSLVKKGEKVCRIKPFPSKVIDTTGAGDMYAAGFLYGITHGYDVGKSGMVASFAASKVVEGIGARLEYSLKEEVEKLMNVTSQK